MPRDNLPLWVKSEEWDNDQYIAKTQWTSSIQLSSIQKKKNELGQDSEIMDCHIHNTTVMRKVNHPLVRMAPYHVWAYQV